MDHQTLNCRIELNTPFGAVLTRNILGNRSANCR